MNKLKIMIDGQERSPKDVRFEKINNEDLTVLMPEFNEELVYPKLSLHLEELRRAEESTIIKVMKHAGVELDETNAHRVQRIFHHSDKGKYILAFDNAQLGMVYLHPTKVEFVPGEVRFNTK